MRVGYGKIGRSMPLSLAKCGNLGGDVEMVAVVKTLALRHPDDEFWLIGRNTGEDPQSVGLPSNVINPWTTWAPQLLAMKQAADLNKSDLTIDEHRRLQDLFDTLTLPTITSMDQIILWAGQHGTTNMPIPSIKDVNVLTKPYDWCAHYCSYLLRGVNVWRDVDPWSREEIWLNSDARNRLKMRDLKWPLRHPVLTQHTFTHRLKHERFSDATHFEEWSATHDVVAIDTVDGRWASAVDNVYARLEINGLMPDTPFGSLISFNDRWEDRHAFGLFVNETRKYVSEATARVNVLREWVLPLQPQFIHGTWSDESQTTLGIEIKPAPWDRYFPTLHSVLCTFTTPASGTGWATAKPWEAFAAGTVCFFHPLYDTQDNILGDAESELRKFLRVSSPAELHHRVTALQTDREAWLWLVHAQRAHFNRATHSPRFIELIEKRIYG